MKWKLIFFLLLITKISTAQKKASYTYQLFGETYAGLNINNIKQKKQAYYLYNYTQLRKPAINVALSEVNYNSQKVHANIGLIVGSYQQANYSAEPKLLRNLYTANVGIRLLKKREIWLDAGIMNSHIGFEGIIAHEQPTLTRSFMADNSPYYENGIKVSGFSINKKWFWNILALQGWQQIGIYNGAVLQNMGMQFTYKPNKKWLWNYGNFWGNNQNRNLSTTRRFYNNFYAIQQGKANWQYIYAYDLGIAYDKPSGGGTSIWHTGAFIAQKAWRNKRHKTAARLEYISDTKGALYEFAGVPTTLRAFSTSVNHDILLTKKLLWRNEVKYINQKNFNVLSALSYRIKNY